MTKITSAAPGGTCPTWLRFLDQVAAGDKDLQQFLQRVVGYCLTGSTRDHALFFLYGTGGNGKSVFLNTLSRLLGDYAAIAPMSTFVATSGDQHPTDLAGLRGARIVSAQETEEGRRWAEAKIKSLTGGDPISARYMRQDFFTFQPQFKLVIAGNHRPSLRNVDEAIRRRFHLVPFVVTIPAGERDEELPEKLRSEWGGILTWAIQGCLDWQRQGLSPPRSVIDATEKYLSEEDVLVLWLEERCEVDPRGWETTGALFRSWCIWAQQNGEPPWSAKRFGQSLEKKGFTPAKRGGFRVYLGLRLLPDGVPDAHREV